MKFKKILAAFLSVAMVVGILPATTFAKLTDTAISGNKKAKMEMVFMKKIASPGNGNIGYEVITTQDIAKTENTVFYVGIRTKDFKYIQETADYDSNSSPLAANTFGLNDITAGVSFDSEYLEFEPSAYTETEYVGTVYRTFSAATALSNTRARINFTNATAADTDGYTYNSIMTQGKLRQYTAYAESDMNPSEDNLAPGDTARGFRARVLLNVTNPAYDYSMPNPGNADVYLAIIEFRIKKDIGEDVTAATPLIGFSASDETSGYQSMKFGKDGVTDYVVSYEDNGKKEVGDAPDFPTQDIREVVDYPQPEFIEAPDPDALTELIKKNDATKPLSSYKENETLDPTGLKVTPKYKTSGEVDSKSVEITDKNDFKGLTFYVAAEGATSLNDLDKTRPITPTTKFEMADGSTASEKRHLYVVYTDTAKGKSALADLGELTISADSVSSINIKEGTDENNKQYTDFDNGSYFTIDNITNVLTRTTDPKTLTIDVVYASGTPKTVKYSEFGDKFALYRAVDGTGASTGKKVLAAIPATGDDATFKVGDKFYVAEAGKEGTEIPATDNANDAISAAMTPTITSQFLMIKGVTAGADNEATIAKALKYSKDTQGTKVFKLDDIKLDTYLNTGSADDAAAQTVSEAGANLKFFYAEANDANPAYSDANEIENGTTEYDTTKHNGKKLYVVPAGDTTKTPVLIGTLGDRAVVDATTGNSLQKINTALTYGDSLAKAFTNESGGNTELTLNYDNGDTAKFIYDDTTDTFKTAVGEHGEASIALADADVSIKVGNTDVTDISDTVIKIGENQKITFQHDTNGTKTTVCESVAITVAPKAIKYTISGTAPTKTYDGNAYIPGTHEVAGTNDIKATVSVDDLVADDKPAESTPAVTTVDVEGLDFAYNSKMVEIDAAAADADKYKTKKIVVSRQKDAQQQDIPLTLTNVTDSAKKYTITADTGVLGTGDVATAITGAEITPKTIKVTKIDNVPSLEVGATEGLVGTETLTLKNNSEQDTNSEIVKGDDVKLKYQYKYAPTDVGSKGDPVVTIKADGKADDNTTDLGLISTDAINYVLDTANLPETRGTVENKVLSKIVVNTAPKALTYPTTALDLDDMEIEMVYEGAATPTVWDAETFLNNDGIITLTDANGDTKTIDKTTDLEATPINLAVGETTLTLTCGTDKDGKPVTTTTKVKVSPKAIKLSDIIFDSKMVYGDEKSKVDTFEFPTEDGKGLVGDDKANVDVKVDATYTFTENPLTTGKNKEVVISKITLGGNKGDCYVIVDDEGNPITDNTTTKVNTGVVSQGSQEPPEDPAVEVDRKTNNIVVTKPLDANGRIEYTIGDPTDENCKWQKDNVFTGLDRNKEYTVYARTAETEDHNYGPSVPTKGATAKTYANRVRAFKKSADITTATPEKDFYTDLTEAGSANDVNTKIFDKKPSRFNAYFKDSACKTDKVTYPLTIGADTVLYYTTSGGGGGGGGVSVSLSLSAASANGLIGDKIKIDATIKGSTGKPTWKSSDEKVATVDDQGNIVMVGEGTATVTVTVAGVSKTVKVTVGKPEATPTPTPTTKPTDAPVIPDNYLKPYVSGYDEGDFRPENAITRAELATMIAKLAYGDDLPDGVYDASFWDVESDAWYNKYIGYLENLNILNGYDEGDFRPNNLISRGEICAVIVRAQKFNMVPYAGLFTDVTEDDWAKDYIQTLASMDIATGYEDGSFGPYNSLIRAEAVTIINRLLAPSEPIVTWTPWDISGHWAESAIMLAANERKLIGAEPAPAATPEATEAPSATTAPEATEVPGATTAPEAEAPAGATAAPAAEGDTPAIVPETVQ